MLGIKHRLTVQEQRGTSLTLKQKGHLIRKAVWRLSLKKWCPGPDSTILIESMTYKRQFVPKSQFYMKVSICCRRGNCMMGCCQAQEPLTHTFCFALACWVAGYTKAWISYSKVMSHIWPKCSSGDTEEICSEIWLHAYQWDKYG